MVSESARMAASRVWSLVPCRKLMKPHQSSFFCWVVCRIPVCYVVIVEFGVRIREVQTEKVKRSFRPLGCNQQIPLSSIEDGYISIKPKESTPPKDRDWTWYKRGKCHAAMLEFGVLSKFLRVDAGGVSFLQLLDGWKKYKHIPANDALIMMYQGRK